MRTQTAGAIFLVLSLVLPFLLGGCSVEDDETIVVYSEDPAAVDDHVVTLEFSPVLVDVLANDTDPQGDLLFVTGLTPPAHGTVVHLGGGTVEYVPDAHYAGTDLFSYVVEDGYGGLGSALVFVTVVGHPRVSVDSFGAEGNLDSYAPSISADGRYVAFDSDASNLVLGDGNGLADIFVHDRPSGRTERVSVATDGTEADGNSYAPALSADGRYVAFESEATNLVAPPTAAGLVHIYVHDRLLGVTELVSLNAGGFDADDNSYAPSISADGRHVAFSSYATNLAGGASGTYLQVYVHDRLAWTNELASAVDGGTTPGDGDSDLPAISADGYSVAFQSVATNLIASDTNGWSDVFVRDLPPGVTERVSVSSAGAEATGGGSYSPSISADGLHVAFDSDAVNLVAGDTGGWADVFVRDRWSGQTGRVSVATNGTPADGHSLNPAISADGRYVAFESFATTLGPADGTYSQIYVNDGYGGWTDLVSVDLDRIPSNGDCGAPAMPADGRHVAFQSAGTNLVPFDTNGATDLFVLPNPPP